MKIKKGFELQNICGEDVVIATGIENIDFSKLITLNESGAFLFAKVADTTFDAQQLAVLLCEEYEVSSEQAAADAEEFCRTMIEAGIAE